jgi:hypothetical protein
LNLAIAVLMNRSIEAGSGLAESLFLGSGSDELGRVLGFEGFGKFSFDVLINDVETDFITKAAVNLPQTARIGSMSGLDASVGRRHARPSLLYPPRNSLTSLSINNSLCRAHLPG